MLVETIHSACRKFYTRTYFCGYFSPDSTVRVHGGASRLLLLQHLVMITLHPLRPSLCSAALTPLARAHTTKFQLQHIILPAGAEADGGAPPARIRKRGAQPGRVAAQSAQDQSDLPHDEPVQPRRDQQVSDRRVLAASRGSRVRAERAHAWHRACYAVVGASSMLSTLW